MKKNIFQQINEIVKTKFFKIIVAVVILGIVFYMNFDVKRIDKDKLSSLLKKDRTVSKNITDIIDANYETMIKPKESENTTVKKQLIPDSLIKKDIKKEEKLKTITNVFLKLKKIEDNYQRRVENNQINKDRKVKYGDYIYYSNKAMFLDDNNKDNEIRFYTLIEKGDPISDNLIGKKVGDFVIINYYDIYKDISAEDRKKIKDAFEKTFSDINKKYGKNGNKILDVEAIKYKITVLDFVTKKMVDELNLDD